VKGVIETVTLEYIHFCLQQLRNGYSSHETKQKLRSFIKEENTENSSVSYDSYGAPKMYKMFDILVGTSMGAIISVALARLHMQPKELREEVVEIARDIFPPSAGRNRIISFALFAPVSKPENIDTVKNRWKNTSKINFRSIHGVVRTATQNSAWLLRKQMIQLFMCSVRTYTIPVKK